MRNIRTIRRMNDAGRVTETVTLSSYGDTLIITRMSDRDDWNECERLETTRFEGYADMIAARTMMLGTLANIRSLWAQGVDVY